MGGGVRKEVAICGRGIKYNHSARLPTSWTLQSNGSDVGNGDGNEVADDKEADGKGAKSNGNGDKGGGQESKRAMVRA